MFFSNLFSHIILVDFYLKALGRGFTQFEIRFFLPAAAGQEKEVVVVVLFSYSKMFYIILLNYIHSFL